MSMKQALTLLFLLVLGLSFYYLDFSLISTLRGQVHDSIAREINHEFTVYSASEYPVLFITILGYPSLAMRPLAKFVVLNNGTDEPSPLVRMNAKVLSSGGWDIIYRIHVVVPLSIDNRLSFRVNWRHEYSSWSDALADYPTPACSFQGHQRGRFVATTTPLTSENNATVASIGPWLRRSNARDDWDYYDPDDDMTCEKKWNEARPYKVTIIGDSQPTHMCRYLEAKGTTFNTSCIERKGKKVNKTIVDSREVNSTLIDFRERYTQTLLEAVQTGGGVVLFNVQGLWEAAYGQLSRFGGMLDAVLNEMPSDNATTYFFMTTTALHPYTYTPGIYKDYRKWAMVQPRVHAQNRIAKERIAAAAASVNTNKIIHILDLEGLTLLRADDPEKKGDMRHYGNKTNALLLSRILCAVDRTLLEDDG